MSNTFNDGTGTPPVSPTATPLEASAGVPAPDGRNAAASARAALNDAIASQNQSTMANGSSRADVGIATSTGPAANDRDKARAVDPIGSSAPHYRPGPVLAEPSAPKPSQASAQAERSTDRQEPQSGGNQPPRRPPADAISSASDEPEPEKKRTQPPLLDIEEFIREVEESKRGAMTRRQIISLGDYIKELANCGVPIGPIYKGLKKRGLVSCSRSRFGELCCELFPDIFGSAARRNA